ncbi:hypothetical protein GCM10009853_011330 [Glycomyces scopariae]
MHRSEPEPPGGGRLHGRLLQILGAFSGVVALVAMWQLGVFGGGSDREPVSAVDAATTTEWPSGAAESSSAAAAAEASSSALESPSASASPTESASPSHSPTTGAPHSEDEAPEEEEEHEEEEAPAEAYSCVAYLSLDDEWQDTVDVSVEVVNTGGERLGYWEIDLDLDDADIYHHWNMEDLGRDWYGAENWNARLDPGEDTVTGFQAEVEWDFDLPSSVPCTASE